MNEQISNARLNTMTARKILHFLWRWKVATTAGLWKRFYPSLTLAAVYYRLWRMERAGLLDCKTNSGLDYFWMLSKKGFEAIKQELPPLAEAGYRSEHWGHDLITSAIHLGDGLFNSIAGLEYWTEQELRRLDPEFYPD